MTRRLSSLFTEIKETRPASSLIHLTPSRVHGVVPRSSLDHAGQEALRENYQLKPVRRDDFVITMSSWESGIEWVGIDGGVSPDYVPIRLTSKDAQAAFLKHALKSKPILEYLGLFRTGIRQGQRLQWNKVRDARIALPSVGMQAAIARYLDHETTRIDALLAHKEKLLLLLEERRQATIGLEFAGVDRYCRVKHMCHSVRDGTHAPPPAVPGIHRLLSVRNMIGGEVVQRDDDRTMTPEAFHELERSYSIRSGDTLVAVVGGTTGKVALVGNLKNCTVQRSTAILRPRAGLNPRFLFYWMQSHGVQKAIAEIASKYAAQPGIYLEDVASLPGVAAPRKRQDEIVAHIDAAICNLQLLARKIQTSIDLLRERRQALVTAAVTGQLDPSVYMPKQEAVAA